MQGLFCKSGHKNALFAFLLRNLHEKRFKKDLLIFHQASYYGLKWSEKNHKKINETLNPEGHRSEPINWNGKKDNGGNIDRGFYVYRLTAKNEDGSVAKENSKLIYVETKEIALELINEYAYTSVPLGNEPKNSF